MNKKQGEHDWRSADTIRRNEFILYIMPLLILQILFSLAQPYLLTTTKFSIVLIVISFHRSRLLHNLKDLKIVQQSRAMKRYNDKNDRKFSVVLNM